ncbi:MAG: cytidine deaminase [Ruminococcaceae bacterium]|nr:cytidine deaminase [Oscillospiraceae bacterium]
MDRETKDKLIDAAYHARFNARVPTSGFKVGAALLTKEGEIITGCNVEISSTLSSVCSERTAIVKAVSMGYDKFVAIAVVSDSDKPISPCGFCRQYLADFGKDIIVIMANRDRDKVVEMTAGELLPMS